jgi:radical SAM superfamily enzyme YgiQ (UPF0313 family)
MVTPPLLEPNAIYPAMPLLAGQLIHNGYNAKNLDLNVKFFRKILSQEYILKTQKLLQEKNILYNKTETNFLIQNINNAIEDYRNNYPNCKKETMSIIESTLRFISLPYDSFELKELKNYEHCFKCFDYKDLKPIIFDKEKNIFIDFFQNVIDDIKKQSIDIVAITIPFLGTIIPALTLANLLKENTNIYVTIGGNFLRSDYIINNPEFLDIYCDFVLLGDGEKSIVELVKCLDNKQTKENIPGLIYKDSTGKIKYNEPEQITNMEDIANFSFDGLDFNEYLLKDPYIFLIISKGCYWGKCNFCSLGPKYKQYCIKRPQKVVQEIKELKEKYNISGPFCFQDDAIHPKYLNNLANEINKANLKIIYSIFARFEKEFTPELIKKLQKSGLCAVYWGLESGSKKIIKAMNKGINLDIVQGILKESNAVGIKNMAGIIVNFPTETIEDCKETIEFIKTIKDYVTISPGEFTVMRNSNVEKNNEYYCIKKLHYNDFAYSPNWIDMTISENKKKEKWNYFCKSIKDLYLQIDSNKNI